MHKIFIDNFNTKKELKNISHMRSGLKTKVMRFKNGALEEVLLNDMAQPAYLAQENNIEESLLFKPGSSGLENISKASKPAKATSLYIIPPIPSCTKRDKSVSGTLYRRCGLSGMNENKRLQEAFNFLRKKTAEFPAWAKRHCRRQGIVLFLTHWKDDEEGFFSRLREAYKEWQKKPWNSLPADLPKRAEESSDQWLDRCYEAAGFITEEKWNKAYKTMEAMK